MNRDILAALAARAGFKLTPAEAHRRLVCIRCERNIGSGRKWTREDLAEWALSALCPTCFDEIMVEPPE